MSEDILVSEEGPLGRATLNRPKALNALNHDMVRALEGALIGWERESRIRLVLIDAAGDKAFCAGGDIAALYAQARAGDLASPRRFWAEEYRLNALIRHYPKPYVAFMDGIVMGGGVGVSAHGSHRVVTERSMVAMPECAIGLTPDVGGSLLLAEAPGRIGEYLALTGTRMGAGEAIHAGLADHFVPSGRLRDLTAKLAETGDAGVIAEFAEAPPSSRLTETREKIDRFFEAPDALQILHRLEADGSDWAKETAAMIRKGSPLSVECSLRILRAAREDPRIEAALAREYRFTYRSISEGELLEGIRAAVIDKDKTPRWSPARLEDLPEARVAAMLASLGDEELKLERAPS